MEEQLGSHTKAAAVIAFKWAAGLSAGFILGPIFLGITSGSDVSGKLIAEKLIVGVFSFPIIFLGLWIWGAQSKKNPITGVSLGSEKATIEIAATTDSLGKSDNSKLPKKPSKWNYVGIGSGLFMLLFLFIPEMIDGTLANQYYLGAAFWVGVIIYSTINILSARK
jgi:hypothetical protein